jgi:hypothetical protein
MALGYEIGTVMRRTSTLMTSSAGEVTVKFDDVEHLGKFVQVGMAGMVLVLWWCTVASWFVMHCAPVQCCASSGIMHWVACTLTKPSARDLTVKFGDVEDLDKFCRSVEVPANRVSRCGEPVSRG